MHICLAAAASYNRGELRTAHLIFERMCQICTRARVCIGSGRCLRIPSCMCAGDPQMQREAAHTGAVPPRLDATLCFADDSDETAAAAWASDDVGGFQCYFVADDEADAAAETYTCVSATSGGTRAGSSYDSPSAAVLGCLPGIHGCRHARKHCA